MKFRLLPIVMLCLLASCFSRPSLMTMESFDNIQMGSSIQTVEKSVGDPYAVHTKGVGISEYEYVERVRMGNQFIDENHYFLTVVNGQVVGKRISRESRPAYDLIYVEDPNYPSYKNYP